MVSTPSASAHILKDPSQPPPFSMSLKLLILHEAKSYCFTVSRVLESVFDYLL